MTNIAQSRMEKAQATYFKSVVFFIALIGIVVTGAMTAITWQVVTLHGVAEENQKISKTIESCTTPKGECAQQGTKRGANLGTAIIVCSRRTNVTTSDQAYACMVEVTTSLETSSP